MSSQSNKIHLPASAHVRSENIKIGKSLQDKAKIYLDQRWWIHCRQAMFNETCTDNQREICHLLQALVKSGSAVCPMAEPVFSELLKIPDESTRKNMAVVIDELSLGYSLQSDATLDRIELLDVLTRILKIKTEGHNIHNLVWTHLSWVLGLKLPIDQEASLVDTARIQSDYFDNRVSSTTMVDFVSEWDPVTAKAAITVDDRQIIEAANNEIDSYGRQRPLFSELFLRQCAVAVEKLRPALINDVAAYLWTKMKGESAGILPIASRDNVASKFICILINRYVEAGTAFELPAVQIPAAIIAAKVSSGHKFRHGDYWDIRHARFALPYCTHFLTERSLASLVVGKPGNAANLYQCKVLSDEEKIIKELQAIT
tara:strand:+ start:5604 stop:6719 length:1116 start_codon:yes stop_codon:yes gene_type:complete